MFNLSLLGLFRGFVLDFVKKQLHAVFQTIYDTRTNRVVQFILIRQISCLDKHQNATCFSQKETAPCLLLVSWSLNPYDSLLQVTYIIQLVQFVVPFLHGISSWFLMLDMPLFNVNLFLASTKYSRETRTAACPPPKPLSVAPLGFCTVTVIVSTCCEICEAARGQTSPPCLRKWLGSKMNGWKPLLQHQ